MSYKSLFYCSSIIAMLSLGGCSSIQSDRIGLPDNSQELLRLEASGEQIFRCARDYNGWYWKFEAPNAYLFDPQSNQAVAKHGYNFTFVHNDGSKLVSRISRTAPNAGHLPDALFAVTERSGRGELSRARFVLRTNTVGGLPKTRCSESQKDKILRVPFSCDFIFYK